MHANLGRKLRGTGAFLDNSTTSPSLRKSHRTQNSPFFALCAPFQCQKTPITGDVVLRQDHQSSSCALVLVGLLHIAGCAVALTLGGGLLAGCSPKGKEPAAAQQPDKKPEAEPRVKHGTNDEVIITLDEATQKTMGLQTAPLEKAQLPAAMKAYGHVLDPWPLATLVAELITAQAAAAASDSELKRLQALAAQDNASQRTLQTAQAAATRDKVQVDSIRLHLVTTWGSNIAGRSDLAEFVQSLSSLSSALAQLNLSAGESLPAQPVGARVLTLADTARPIEAQVLGPAPTTDPQMQNRGFLVFVAANSARLAPGEAISGFLNFPGEPQVGVAVPLSAVVQFNGERWVYVQAGSDEFRRTELKKETPLENASFVREGLSPGDKIVIVGAQQLLSEELKGQGGE